LKVLLDEGVPEPLAEHLGDHEVQSVRQIGHKGTKNGKLLKVIGEVGFDVFITNDKKMEEEQQLQGMPFGVLILSACNLPVILPHVAAIRSAIDACSPGSVRRVECGRFTTRPKRKRFYAKPDRST
jgi:predicted nuclease of predicted toxin-antitoxin system